MTLVALPDFVVDPEPPDRPLTATQLRLVVLALRDGWACHYCGIALVPKGDEESVCTWVPGAGSYAHCGCGRHAPGEPCISRGCWSLPDGFARPETDHVLPRSRGGSDDLSNLVLSCQRCNATKGRRTPEEWLGAAWRDGTR